MQTWRASIIGVLAGGLATLLVVWVVRSPAHETAEQRDCARIDSSDHSPRKPAIDLRVAPSGAIVWLDGQLVADKVGANGVVLATAEGHHRLKILHEGFVPIERDVMVPAEGISMTVALDPSHVALTLDVRPESAHVVVTAGPRTVAEVNGSASIVVARERGMELVVRAEAAGYQSVSRVLDPFGDQHVVQLRLPRDEASLGEPRATRRARFSGLFGRPRSRSSASVDLKDPFRADPPKTPSTTPLPSDEEAPEPRL